VVNFETLAWAAFCYYYRSSGDRHYTKLMADPGFTNKLRASPSSIHPNELNQKILLGYIHLLNYDLLVSYKLAESILSTIEKLSAEIGSLQPYSIIEINTNDKYLMESVNRIYTELSGLQGLWITGGSKIAHLLNTHLLPIVGLDVIDQFPEFKSNPSRACATWLHRVKNDAIAVTLGFQAIERAEKPEEYLSTKLGYTDQGVVKSLVKYLDEFYRLHYVENVALPPRWVPERTNLSIEASSLPVKEVVGKLLPHT